MMKRLLITLLLGCSLTAPLSAAELPDYYPPLFAAWGTLQHLNIADGSLVINDRRIRMVSDLRVYTTTTQYGTTQLLRNGMQVGGNPDRQGIIKKLWVLPENYIPQLQVIPLKK